MLIYDAALAPDVFYDKIVKRYRYKDSAKYVSRDAVISLQKKHLAKLKDEFVALSKNIKNGDTYIYVPLADKLKQIYISNLIIAKGGIDNVTQSELGSVGAMLKKQYYAGKDLVTGKNYGLKYLLQESPGQSEAQIANRLKLYAESGDVVKSSIQKNEATLKGAVYYERKLAAAEHCPSCVYYASLGRQEISSGILPLPKTNCECKSNCQCSLEYYDHNGVSV